MSIWFYAILNIIILVCLIFVIIKLFLIKKSMREIRADLRKILKSDTNNLLTVSSYDKDVRNLTNDLNEELGELRKQRLQYENGNQELKKSITNISHDLRTPLTAISGYLDLLKEENLNDKQNMYVEVVNNKTNELILLTEQLFDFSKSLDLERKINRERCCINDILEETIVSYYKMFKEKNITPHIEICEKKIYKNVDKSMLIRIFENLISNTIKYSDDDCNIVLEKDGKIVFSNKAIELDLTTVKRIFDRYYTVENAKKHSGIGLSIVKQLVEMNGGYIEAKYLKSMLYIEIELL